MKIDTYQSTRHPRRFLFVRRGENVDGLTVEGDDAPLYAQVKPLKKVDFEPGDKRIGADTAKVIADINAKGYSLG